MTFTKKELYAIVSIVVVIVVILSAFVVVPNLEKPKQEIILSKYIKVSNGDLLSNGQDHIYFISWYGCPIGADNSWVLYSLLNSTKNVSSDVELHKSIAGTPGLLFLNGTSNYGENISFQYAGVPFTFTSLYLYNQTMTGTVYNHTMNSSNRVNYGLSLLKGNLPATVYQIAKTWETQVGVENKTIKNRTGTWSAMTGHLVTMLIVTGPDGTFVHFWFMYPSLSKNVSSLTVYTHLNNYPEIQSAENTLLYNIGGSNIACA